MEVVTGSSPDDLERDAGKWMGAVATGKPHENELKPSFSEPALHASG